MPTTALTCFAATAPGLESLCAAELKHLGIEGAVEEGGVSWRGSIDTLMRANLWLRTASRVLVRVAEFRATSFFELERHAKKVPWAQYLSPSGAVSFRVTCRKSRLYHSEAVAERLGRAALAAVKGVSVVSASSDDDEDDAVAQLFVVRFYKDVCTVSVDSSGALLHRRGYRQQIAKAPLRETLAAAMLLGAGWTGETPLLDPMCGSGTIVIEGAMIARRMAPGRNRSFAFLNWKTVKSGDWQAILAEARKGELPASPVSIAGADRDAGAIDAARSNAERAGVEKDLVLEVAPVSALPEAAGNGLVAVNPPYGVRVGETAALRNLFARFGDVLRVQRPGWRLVMLSADRALDRQTRLPLEAVLTTKNGGIPVRLAVASISESDGNLSP